ncbi:ABC transporter substrate-binding protein [Roseomonas sp. SSH11]|uniref:Thiamine pyrimidine synthase n=1 Tax=Pararoseomonas baculiformis TaxID=2820812 RepID=A0ABS4AG78_9PROT|nr:ABC transporter substrate-binding protein [Pararoseomonas baculiformis]MBP0446038.1 ABC transporter substrate-binding protein [Pararoseomonas baculiformis]
MSLHRRTLLATGASLPLALPAVRSAAAQAPIRFCLDWALQGNHGMFALAEDRGVFRREGLAVRMDRGFGSGDTAVKVAAGAYDIGYTDVSTMVKFNAENPDKRLVSIYQVLDRTATALITLRKSGITDPKAVAGKRLGAPEGEASRMLFPAFARVAGIEASGIRWTSMAANLRDTMLAQGQVDAVTGFLFTTFFNLVGLGVKEEDIMAWPYAENGLDIYGSAVVARVDWLERNPQQAAAFVKASVEGLKMLLNEPDAGMAALKRHEPLFDEALEKRRWAMTRDRSILTPHVRANASGAVDMGRAETLIRVNAEAYGVTTPPKAAEMFTERFLPPASERRIG